VVYDMNNGEKIRKVYGHTALASIIEIAWSALCKFIASADDCGRLIAKRLRKPTVQQNTWAVYPLRDFRPVEAVYQLLFSASEDYLLVSSSTCDWVWSLKERKELCRSQHPPNKRMKWMNHPVLEDRLICIDCGELQKIFWNGLEQVRSTDLSDFPEYAETALPTIVSSELPDIQALRRGPDIVHERTDSQ
jgi:hypothetical protein